MSKFIPSKYTTVQLTKEVYGKLIEVRSDMMIETRKNMSLSDAVDKLCEYWSEKNI